MLEPSSAASKDVRCYPPLTAIRLRIFNKCHHSTPRSTGDPSSCQCQCCRACRCLHMQPDKHIEHHAPRADPQTPPERQTTPHTSTVRPTDHVRKDRQLHIKSHRRQQDAHKKKTGSSQCKPTDVHNAETFSSSVYNASRGAAAHDSISAAAVVKMDQSLHEIGLSVSTAGLTHVHLGLAIIIQLLQRRALCHLGDEMEHLGVYVCHCVCHRRLFHRAFCKGGAESGSQGERGRERVSGRERDENERTRECEREIEKEAKKDERKGEKARNTARRKPRPFFLFKIDKIFCSRNKSYWGSTQEILGEPPDDFSWTKFVTWSWGTPPARPKRKGT